MDSTKASRLRRDRMGEAFVSLSFKGFKFGVDANFGFKS